MPPKTGFRRKYGNFENVSLHHSPSPLTRPLLSALEPENISDASGCHAGKDGQGTLPGKTGQIFRAHAADTGGFFAVKGNVGGMRAAVRVGAPPGLGHVGCVGFEHKVRVADFSKNAADALGTGVHECAAETELKAEINEALSLLR